MVVEYIRYKVDPSQRESFIAAYTEAASQLDDSGYCLAYQLAECEEEVGQFILRIDWTSREEHLNGFRKSELFPPFFSLLKGFYSNIQEMRHYQPIPLHGKKERVH